MYEKVLNQMKNLLKNTDLIIVTDNMGKVMYYNNFNDKLNKYGNQDAIGKYIFELYPWLTRENSTIFKVIETGEPLVNHVQNIKLDGGNEIYAINSAFPLINDHGIVGAIEISTDLTHDNKLNKGKSKKKYSNLAAKYNFDDFITINPQMQNLINTLTNVSKNDSNVFVYGETGTGKEILAHAIHQHSPRNSKPFIAQNCAAIPSSLFESLLFGSTKGSYTGSEDKPGLFEIANGGTVYLDEINSMPLDLQSKLLRVIEEKVVKRIGSHNNIPVDIRFIASTNENPTKILEERKIRADLFFRLNVVNAEILPLRERKEDIKVLLKYYINYFNVIFNKKVSGIDPNAEKLLLEYSWPGNVRELKNFVESVYNIIEESIIGIHHLPNHIISYANKNKYNVCIDKSLPALMEDYEKEIIEKILIKNKYNVYKTAAELGVPRQTLYYKLNKYDILQR